MAEYEFSKKPRRMTDPPQNKSEWLPGYDGVEVIMETDPRRIAYFAREATWGDIMAEPTEAELADTIAEVARGKVLGAAYKGGFGFRIRASRTTMDQALRLAEGKGGSGSGAGAQTTRDNDQRNFNIIVPNTIEHLSVDGRTPNTCMECGSSNVTMKQIYEQGASAGDNRCDDCGAGFVSVGITQQLYNRVRQYVDDTRKLYGDLVDAGVPPQDARYVALPLGFQTQWMWIVPMEGMIKLCEQRLCNGLTQHETDFLIRMMRDRVVAMYPEYDKILRSSCEKSGQCASRTMLFPPCGAFVDPKNAVTHRKARDEEIEEYRLEITQYDPAKHLYPADKNDAMQMAAWDVERVKLERENPDEIYCFVGPPVPLRLIHEVRS